MKLIAECKISKKKAKENFIYPIIRLPSKYKEIIGKEAEIYEIGSKSFLIVVKEDDKENNEVGQQLYNLLKFLSEKSDSQYSLTPFTQNLNSASRNIENSGNSNQTKWGRRDLNSGHRLPRPGG